MSHFAYNIKTDEDGIPKIKTWNNLQRLNQFRKDIFDPYSLDKKADTVLKSIGDPRDPRTFGERMADNILSDLQSNTLKHNRQNYEVNFGGEWAKRLDKYSKRGRNMICWLDKEPEDLKREMELFEKMDTTVGLSKEQKEYVKNIQKVIDTKEDIFVHRGVNNVMFMSSPSLTSISFWDDNVDGGRVTEMDIEKIDPDIREFFYSEMENVEIAARRRMVDEICQKTQLPKELFLEGVYESPFDGVEKPRYNNHLIEKFIDKRDYLETPYELSRMMTASGKVYGNPETEEERKEGLRCEKEVERILGKEPDRIIRRSPPNYVSIGEYHARTPENRGMHARFKQTLKTYINGRPVKPEQMDYAMSQITRTGDFARGMSHKTGKFAIEQGVRGASFRMAGYPVEWAEKAIKSPSKQIEQGDTALMSILQQVFSVMGRGVQTR